MPELKPVDVAAAVSFDAVIAPAAGDLDSSDEDDDEGEELISAEFDAPSSLEDEAPELVEEPWETTLTLETLLTKTMMTTGL